MDRSALPAVIDVAGQICTLPNDELYMAMQEIQATRDRFPLLVAIDKRPKKSLLPRAELVREPAERNKDFCSLARLVNDCRKANAQMAGER